MAITGSAISGLEAGGTVSAIIAAIAAVVGLGISITANSRKRRKESAVELQDEYERGKKDERERSDDNERNLRLLLEQAQRNEEFWRNSYVAMLRGDPLPLPPQQIPIQPSD